MDSSTRNQKREEREEHRERQEHRERAAREEPIRRDEIIASAGPRRTSGLDPAAAEEPRLCERFDGQSANPFESLPSGRGAQWPATASAVPIPASEAEIHRDGPRERLHAVGARGLSDAELVALVLRTGGAGRDALDLSRALLEQWGGLVGLRSLVERDVCDQRGVGPAKLASLCAALELGRRIAGGRAPIGKAVRGPEDVQRYFHPRLRDTPHELFLTLLLDSRHRVTQEVVVSQGTLTASLVHPREVFRKAVQEAAAALILVHNHPSGDPSPSAEDRRVTERLVEAGALMGIRVLDHVVVAEHGYFSFSEAGEI